MSLLDKLKSKRAELKSVATHVTTPGGLTFVESFAGDGSTVRTGLQLSSSPGFVVDTKPDLQIAWVLPRRLGMGSQDVALDRDLLCSNNFTHILSLGIEIPELYLGFSYKYIEFLDLPETRLADILETCFQFLDEALVEGKVYVHCNAGVSRSAAVMLGFLMRGGRSYNQAFHYLKEKRNVIRPNEGFVRQLRELEKTL